MECGVSVRIGAFLVALLLVAPTAVAADADAPMRRSLVLVRADRRGVAELAVADVRRAYLGTPAQAEGVVVRPLLNVAEPLLYRVFLQKVVFMSARTYERHVLSHVFRLGGSRPPRFSDLDSLLSALRAREGAVTFMWEEEAERTGGLEIVTTLWEGVVE